MNETILTNATIVTPDEAFSGTLVLHGDHIAEVAHGPTRTGIDMGRDFLIPGIVDLHTDNLERQVLPRANARWPSRSALLAHDAQCAAAGITTALDALCVGIVGPGQERIQTFRDAVRDLDALAEAGALKSEHFLHLRCELPAADMRELFEPVAHHSRVRMLSVMDHTPGLGQYADLDHYRAQRRKEGLSPDAIERLLAERHEQRQRMRGPNRELVLAVARATGVALASHDDRTAGEVAENAALGIGIAEFPVTLEAAEAARVHGMAVIAGAPNLVRGGSHSGNVAVARLLEARAVDAFASDYVPASLLEAAFRAAATLGLPAAIGMVTSHPAAMAHLADRGTLATGQRADFLRVRLCENLPVVRETWRAGIRIA